MKKPSLEQEYEILLKSFEEQKERIKELESELEELREPIPIDLVFDVLPEKDAINLVSRLQSKLYARIKGRIEKLENEKGLLENNLEIFELNARNTSLGRIFKNI